MLDILNNNQIRLTKGDTAVLKFKVYRLDGVERQLTPADELTLTIKRTQTSATPVLQLTADEEHCIVFKPEHTKNLAADLYMYDVRVKTDNDDIYTVIPLTFFELQESIGG